MQFLRGLLTNSDIADIAAYIGSSAGVDPGRPPPPSYEGLWLNSSESGWGINIVHQGDVLFATWFTYDTDGSGMWLVMSNGVHTGLGTFSGDLYRTTGPSFNAVPFASIEFPRNYTRVGTMTLSFSDTNTGTMSYNVDGKTQSKSITRFNFVAQPPACALGAVPNYPANYTGLWWSSPPGTEAGWGLNVVHQGNRLFVTWFTYLPGGSDANKGMWLVMSDARLDDIVFLDPDSYTGALQTTTGPPFDAVPFDPGRVKGTTVGSGTLTFFDPFNGEFVYAVNGTMQTKRITRYVYAIPMTVCR